MQADDGKFYPAGIYLGGFAQTLVRAIDSEVVDLINRAQISGNGGGNNTSGGVGLWSPGLTTQPYVAGLFRVNFAPSNIVALGAGWRVQGAEDPTWINGTNLYYPRDAGQIRIEFKTVVGFSAPPVRPVEVIYNQTTVIDAFYSPISLSNPGRLPDGGFQMTLSGGTGRVYSIQASSGLDAWTDILSLTNQNGTVVFTNAPDRRAERGFYRAKEQP